MHDQCDHASMPSSHMCCKVSALQTMGPTVAEVTTKFSLSTDTSLFVIPFVTQSVVHSIKPYTVAIEWHPPPEASPSSVQILRV
jgi:hypothetical protein